MQTVKHDFQLVNKKLSCGKCLRGTELFLKRVSGGSGKYGGFKFFKPSHFTNFRQFFFLYLSLNVYGSQHDYVDFGLNVTFACKKAVQLGFEVFYSSSRVTDDRTWRHLASDFEKARPCAYGLIFQCCC